MGSVKDLEILEPASESSTGTALFRFSDRYSVFDWGEMPDHIPGKGKALNMMSAWNFLQLEQEGMGSHFLSLYEDVSAPRFDVTRPSSVMKVKMTRVIPIQNEYELYRNTSAPHYLIPLEIIFRNGLPKGSSMFRKLAAAKDDPTKTRKLLASLGLDSIPNPGDMLPKPVYDFTTKLEASDRALSDDEALRISGLSERAFADLRHLAGKVNSFITRHAESRGFRHFDGKIEAMYHHGEIVLVDVLGTFDENRFLFEDEQVSKEILRQAYIKLQPDFVNAVDEAKKIAADKGEKEWKPYCRVQPRSLPARFIELVSQIYRSGANQYLGQTVFPDVPPLASLIPELRKAKEELA